MEKQGNDFAFYFFSILFHLREVTQNWKEEKFGKFGSTTTSRFAYCEKLKWKHTFLSQSGKQPNTKIQDIVSKKKQTKKTKHPLPKYL